MLVQGVDGAADTVFGQGPVQTAVSVTHSQGAEVARDEHGCAAVVSVVCVRSCARTTFVQVNRRTEGQAVVGFARHGEGDVNVSVELSFDAVATDDTHFRRTFQRNVCCCEASRSHQSGGSKENLFHGFPSFI